MSSRQRRTVIKERILTGLVVLPLLILFLLWTGAFGLLFLLSLVNLLALNEFYAMALSEQRRLERWLGVIGGGLLLPILAKTAPAVAGAVATLAVLLLACWFLFRYLDVATVVRDLALVGFGWLYLPLLLLHFYLLFELPFGRQWLFLVMLMVMATDSAAFFVGSAIGRTPLYPAISPKKSREGAAGGLLGCLLAGFIAKGTFFPQLSVADVLFVGVLVGVSGQVGDLFESMLKRSFGVKDSGTLIPGHGGMLDRLDSLLFAFPIAYYYAQLMFRG